MRRGVLLVGIFLVLCGILLDSGEGKWNSRRASKYQQPVEVRKNGKILGAGKWGSRKINKYNQPVVGNGKVLVDADGNPAGKSGKKRRRDGRKKIKKYL